jgi:hypothetical protein
MVFNLNGWQSWSLFVWLVVDGWCFILREKYCWLVAGGWFVLREKYCWLVVDKPSEQTVQLLVLPRLKDCQCIFSWELHSTTQTLTTRARTHPYEYTYANSTPMSTSEGLNTGRSGDSRSHQWRLVVDRNVAHHLTYNAGKSWKIQEKVRAPGFVGFFFCSKCWKIWHKICSLPTNILLSLEGSNLFSAINTIIRPSSDVYKSTLVIDWI